MQLTGLDRLIAEDFSRLKNKKIGLVCNQATVASDYVHLIDHFLRKHSSGDLTIQSVFGPQHGIWGHTQDNMIEWEGYRDARTGLLFHSLYGEHRQPTQAMLEGVDHLVVDLPDIGTRYYTFGWTMALCMKTCEQMGIPVTVLDRPNPINGVSVEGPVGDPAYASFVGLYPVRVRHAMTLGELARHLKENHFPNVQLEVIDCQGWDRNLYLDETEFPWVMPSPNMPTVDTAVVYPGMCLLEGTNLSEGRGTTKPFEMFGAPYIDGYKLCGELNGLNLPGVFFRPVQFLPTFQKHEGVICEGGFMHVTDRRSFNSFLTGCSLLQVIWKMYAPDFKWNDPPYEYEEVLLPIDILLGNSWIREAIEGGLNLREVLEA